MSNESVFFEPCYLVRDSDGEVYGYIEKLFGEWVFVPQINMMSFISAAVMVKITEKIIALREKELSNA